MLCLCMKSTKLGNTQKHPKNTRKMVAGNGSKAFFSFYFLKNRGRSGDGKRNILWGSDGL